MYRGVQGAGFQGHHHGLYAILELLLYDKLRKIVSNDILLFTPGKTQKQNYCRLHHQPWPNIVAQCSQSGMMSRVDLTKLETSVRTRGNSTPDAPLILPLHAFVCLFPVVPD